MRRKCASLSNLNNLGSEAHDTLQHAATHLYLPFVKKLIKITMFIPKAISKRLNVDGISLAPTSLHFTSSKSLCRAHCNADRKYP